MNVIRRKRKVTKPDGTVETRTSAHWFIQWKDANGRTQRRKGYTDRAATRQLAAKLERELARGEVGMTDPYREHRARPLGEHVDAYLADLEASGRDPEYRRKVRQRLGALTAAVPWSKLDDVTLDGFLRWRAGKVKAGTAARTVNHYADAARGFCNWLVTVGRLPLSPLANVPKVEGVEKIQRRSMTVEEVGRLLNAAPSDRRFAWLFLLTTGLRCGEASALQWRDVRLMATRPYLQLRKEATKGRRADRVWLRPEVANELRERRPGKARHTDAVFPRFPSLKLWRKDIEAAGIAYADDAGRTVDRHSTRTTLATLLQRAGVAPRAAQDVLRHTTLQQTMKAYTDPDAFDVAAAVDSLPELATDTAGDGSGVQCGVHPVENRGSRAANA